ncbi:MAG: hypothetical protein AABY22_18130, partial [Nanoarchaeota archaeon]
CKPDDIYTRLQSYSNKILAEFQHMIKYKFVIYKPMLKSWKNYEEWESRLYMDETSKLLHDCIQNTYNKQLHDDITLFTEKHLELKRERELLGLIGTLEQYIIYHRKKIIEQGGEIANKRIELKALQENKPTLAPSHYCMFCHYDNTTDQCSRCGHTCRHTINLII